MPALRYNTEVHLMKPSKPPVTSSILNQSKCDSLVLAQNTMKCIKGLNSCLYLFHIFMGGGVEPYCTQYLLRGDSVGAFCPQGV